MHRTNNEFAADRGIMPSKLRLRISEGRIMQDSGALLKASEGMSELCMTHLERSGGLLGASFYLETSGAAW